MERKSTKLTKKNGEYWRNRHKRRLEFARKNWQSARVACREMGLDVVREYPDGHEVWVFSVNYREIAKWNPWSANFFFGEKQCHLHDPSAVIEELRLCVSLMP